MDKKDLLYMFLPTVLVLAVLAITVAVGLMLRGGEESCRSIRVIELKGDVSIDREGVGSLEASVNMNLISGDRISTSEGAYVVLRLDEDKYVMLGEQGAIQVFASGNAADGRTQIHLETGTIVNDIRNSLSQDSAYEIVISGVAMSVRGTVFEVRWYPDDGTGELLTYEGSVELTLQGKEPVLYSHGEYAQFEAGDAPQFLIERVTITDERMDSRMIPFLYQINERGRELDFGEANFEELIERAREEGLLTIADNRFQAAQELGDSHIPDIEDPVTSPDPTATSLPMTIPGLEDHVMDWQDENLEALMRETIGIMDGDIMLSDVWELRSLKVEAKHASTIKNISALSELTNLTELELPCGLQDISPLSSLTNLTSLYLENNQISDISPLSNLINLESLALYNNQISDISVLSGLTHLTTLYLFINKISDISVLGGLTNLTSLSLDENQISDISALSSLTNLRSLDLSSNQISDISALSSLTYLKSLDLSDNQVTDISALSNLTSLTYLNLSQNPIIDYSVVEFVEKNGGNVIY